MSLRRYASVTAKAAERVVSFIECLHRHVSRIISELSINGMWKATVASIALGLGPPQRRSCPHSTFGCSEYYELQHFT